MKQHNHDIHVFPYSMSSNLMVANVTDKEKKKTKHAPHNILNSLNLCTIQVNKTKTGNGHSRCPHSEENGINTPLLKMINAGSRHSVNFIFRCPLLKEYDEKYHFRTVKDWKFTSDYKQFRMPTSESMGFFLLLRKSTSIYKYYFEKSFPSQ